MLRAKLVIVGGDAKAKEVNLRLPTVIGRGKEATLTIPHALVSRRHCEVFERNGILIVRDLDSLNGTYINNYRIKGEQPLHPGELLTLGNVTFRAVYGDRVAMDTVPDSTQGPTSPVTAPVDLNKTVAADQLTSPAPPVTSQVTSAPTPAPLSKPMSQPKPPLESPEHPLRAEDEINFDEFDFASPQRSISLPALEGLPQSDSSAVSFVGQLAGLDSQADAPLSGIDPGEFAGLEGLAQKNVDPAVDRASLDSFLKKLH